MHLRSFLAGILTVSFVAAIASTVEPTSITRFQAGTPARADDVNSTIQALVDAIDDNARRVEALEQNKTSCSLVERIKDSTFKFYFHYNVIGGQSPMSQWNHYNAFGHTIEVYTFNEDGTFSSNAENNGVFPKVVWAEGIGENEITVQHSSDEFSDDGTWELVGNALTLTFFDGEITATVSPDGNTAFISIIDPFEVEPEQQDALQVPADAQQIVLGVATRIEPYRAPEGLSINVTHIDDNHLNGSILELELADEGSGGCLEFARSPLNGPVAFATPPENGWTKGNVFVVSVSDTGDFWARRDSNEFVTGPVRYNPPSPE